MDNCQFCGNKKLKKLSITSYECNQCGALYYTDAKTNQLVTLPDEIILVKDPKDPLNVLVFEDARNTKYVDNVISMKAVSFGYSFNSDGDLVCSMIHGYKDKKKRMETIYADPSDLDGFQVMENSPDNLKWAKKMIKLKQSLDQLLIERGSKEIPILEFVKR